MQQQDTTYIVSVRPAPGHVGPTLVSDDPALVRVVLDAIRRTYVSERRAGATLRLEQPEPA